MDHTREHYQQAGLTDRIYSELVSAGHELDSLHPDDLAGVDEFHLGGRMATDALLADLAVKAGSRVLDVGCGIGGAARTIACSTGCSVTGVDLTSAFVATARDLSAAVGMADTTTFREGNGLDLPFADAEFDVVVMLHVGMNIDDKGALMKELARVAAPGGTVAIYDIMRVGEGDLGFPMPWASSASASFLASPNDYRSAMIDAGLEPHEAIDRLELVRTALATASEHPPPVDLSHLMGENWPAMFANLRAALGAGVVSPTQLIAHRPPA